MCSIVRDLGIHLAFDRYSTCFLILLNPELAPRQERGFCHALEPNCELGFVVFENY